MASIDPSYQYKQFELPSNVFNAGNGDVVNYNGNAVKVGVNNNGTRSLTDLGSYGLYQSQQQANAAQAANKQAEDTFNTNLTNTVNSLPTPTQTYNTLSSTLGLTDTQNALTSAENTLNRIPTDSKNLATSMGGISADQINERNAVKSSELSPVVQSLANTLGIKNAQFGTLFQGQEQANQRALLPYQYQASFLGQNAQNTFNLMSQEEQQQFQEAMIPLETQATLTEEQAQAAIENSSKLSLLGSETTGMKNGTINPALLQNLNPYSLALGNYLGVGNTGSSGGSGSGVGSGYTYG